MATEVAPSRRQFVAGSVATGAGLYLGCTALAGPPPPVVAIAKNPEVWHGDRVVAAAAADLVERAVRTATGAASATAGLASLFRPGETIGIKINCLAGRGLSTHREVVDALVAGLVRAGIRQQDIIIWDRSDRDLRRARYSIERSGTGPRCFGTNDDYEYQPIEAGSVGGCLSEIFAGVSAVINVPVLKDHDLAGISGALKSLYGAIHNPNKYHDNGCSPYVADLNAHPRVRSKMRLTVFDALRPQCHGGPAWVPENTWKMGAVFAATDPVAADAVALDLITRERRRRGLPTLEKEERAPRWLGIAARRGLGIADLERIHRVSP